MAAPIPAAFKEELLSRVDIVELIDARVPLKKLGRDYGACCPFHQEKSPSFTVSPTKQFYYCFGCGASGNAISFLMEYDHLGYREAVEGLAKFVGLSLPETIQSSSSSSRDKAVYSVMSEAAKFYQQQLKASPEAIDYLKNRGLTGEICRTYGVGYAPDAWESLTKALPKDQNLLLETGLILSGQKNGYYDRFRHRIIFPIRDRRGRVIGFGGRVLKSEKAKTVDAQSPKYLNSPESLVFHKSEALYGIYEALQSNRQIERLIVVEGYMDVIALAQFGITYAVGTMGTATTAQHLQQLFRVCPEIIFCFDGDRAGQQAAWRALEQCLPVLEEGRQVRFMFMPNGKDPDDVVRQEGVAAFQERLKDAQPFSQFLFDTLREKVDLRSVDGQARLVGLATPLLNRLPEGPFRSLLLHELSQQIKLDVSELEKFTARHETDKSSSRSSVQRSPTPFSNAPRKTSSSLKPRSPMRTAITLLLHHPELWSQYAGDKRVLTGVLQEASLPGAHLLSSLIETLEAEPKISMGVILERWRDHPEGRLLYRLAAEQAIIPIGGELAEFSGAMKRLTQSANHQNLDDLLAKARQNPLTGAEKAQLQALLQVGSQLKKTPS